MEFSRTLSDIIMNTMTLSVVIPAYNEERRLPSTLDALFAWLDANSYRDAEVIVVDDGSRDGTAALVQTRAKSDARLRLVKNPGNRGKGYSVRRGMLEAKGDWALFTDADLSAPIEELERLWAAAERGSVQVAIGSRSVDRSLIGVHQRRVGSHGADFQPVMRLSPACRTRYAVRLQAVRGPRRPGDFPAPAAWTVSGST